MTVDLHDALGELALSVQDDGSTDRMTGQVRTMVTRIRRRRAVRHATTGAVSMGAVAAVAVAGVQLAGRDSGDLAGTFAADEASGVRSDETLACGADAPELTPPPDGPAAGWHLDADVEAQVVAGGTVQVDMRLADQDAQLVTWGQATPESLTVAVVQDGRVVSSTLIGFADSREGVSPADYVIFSGEVTQASCDPAGGALAPGEYSVVAAETLVPAEDPGAPVRVTGGPWPFTVVDVASPEPTAGPTSGGDAGSDLEAAQAALEAHLAAPSSDPFPACRSAVLSSSGGLLSLDLALEDRPYARGEVVAGEVTVRTVDGLGVIGNAPTSGAHLVLTLAGMVVGGVYTDTEDVGLLDLGPESVGTVPLRGAMSLCASPATDAPQPGLPPGRYTAYAVMDVMLKEVTDTDGTASSRSDLTVAISQPVDVTIE